MGDTPFGINGPAPGSELNNCCSRRPPDQRWPSRRSGHLCRGGGRAGRPRRHPGASREGRTTLIARCCSVGWSYISDDVLAADRSDGSVHAFARPPRAARLLIGVEARSQRCPEPDGEALVSLAEPGSIAAPSPARHALLTHHRSGRPLVHASTPEVLTCQCCQTVRSITTLRPESLLAARGHDVLELAR